MQAALAFLKHALLSLFLTAHGVFAGFVPHPAVTVVSTATSTTPVTHSFPIVKNKKTANLIATSTPKTTKPAQNISAASGEPGQSSTSALATSVVIPLALPQSQVNDMARAAAVNILCTTRGGGYLNPISGSGVLISGAGVVLTNAHVGQYLLLRDYLVPGNVDCVVRTGSPATPKYHAQLLYLPPAWVDANASQITSDTELGTGENDYAFLLITSTTDPNGTLPAHFPYLPLTLDEPVQGLPMMIASYPAGYLQGITIEMSLYISTAISTVEQIYAFDDRGYPDVVSVGGTVVSQAGSSGGGIVRMQDGALQAIVATASAGDSTATRELHGITLAYINRSLNEAGLGGLIPLLKGDLKQKAADFAATTGASETQTLFKALKK